VAVIIDRTAEKLDKARISSSVRSSGVILLILRIRSKGSPGGYMNRTPLPLSLVDALALPRTPGRSAEVFIDGDLELRFAARPTNGPQVPHQRDELYFVASGTGRYRVEDTLTAVGPGDVLFCAAQVAHGFEEISDDFSVWVLFYGPEKQTPSTWPITT
jgi:mannose-6-phosphate isomerase-like protein (cupin superfamily)